MSNILPWLILFIVFTQVILVGIYLLRLERVGPNQALIVYGRQSPPSDADAADLISTYRVVTGGRTFVWPFVERAECLSLMPVKTELKVTKAPTQDGQHVTLTGSVQFKIRADTDGIVKAARHFLSKSELEQAAIVLEILESHLRQMLEDTSLAELKKSPTRFAEAVLSQVEPQMERMGIEIISLVIRDTTLASESEGAI